MAHAYQLPSGNWRIQVKVDKQKFGATFKTREEAELWGALKKKSKVGRVARIEREKFTEPISRQEILQHFIASLRKELNRIDKMSGIEFEEYCKTLLQNTGLFANAAILKTPDNGDFGADLIIDCDDGTRVVVQCKRYSSNIKVDAVQEVFAAKEYYNSDNTAIITNARFTPSAKELAKSTGTILMGREELLAIIAIANRNIEGILKHSQWELLEEAIAHELSTNKEIRDTLKYD